MTAQPDDTFVPGYVADEDRCSCCAGFHGWTVKHSDGWRASTAIGYFPNADAALAAVTLLSHGRLTRDELDALWGGRETIGDAITGVRT